MMSCNHCTALLEEREKEAEELANLVQNKDEVVENLERRLLNAKKVIAELRQHPQPGQHTRTIWPGSPDDERGQMQHGLCLPSCRLSSEHTTRLPVAIAELKKVDSRELDLVLRDQEVKSVRDLEVVYRKRLRRYIMVMSNMRREGKLLPMKFEARFYEWSILYISPLTKRLL